MDIIISNASDAPIYEQIYTQIKSCILSGALRSGDALPSIRTLAKDLRISVITTKRAYDELEKAGFVDTVPAKGCFVAAFSPALVREENLRQIESHLQAACELARPCGLTAGELEQMLHTLSDAAYE